jgi:hypothetical protein
MMNIQPNNRLSLRQEQPGGDTPRPPLTALEGFAGLLAETAAKHATSDGSQEATQDAAQHGNDVGDSQTD